MSETSGSPPLPGMVLPGPPEVSGSAPVSAAAAPAAPGVAWAGFWRRVWTYLVDTPIVWALGVAVIAVVRLAAGVSIWPISSIFPLWRESAQATPMLNGLELSFAIVLWVGYFAILESSEWQATPGKRVFRLRVTDAAGRRISLGRAVARRFAMILSLLPLPVGFVMAGFTRRRQALHDKVAGTLVIREVR